MLGRATVAACALAAPVVLPRAGTAAAAPVGPAGSTPAATAVAPPGERRAAATGCSVSNDRGRVRLRLPRGADASRTGASRNGPSPMETSSGR